MFTPQLTIIKLRASLNKLHSSDYDNLPDWSAVVAINEAQIKFLRRQIIGINAEGTGDEGSRVRVDDIEFLLNPEPLVIKGRNNSLFFKSDELPGDYMYFKYIIPKATKGACRRIPITSSLVEESNVPEYLDDWAYSPSFEWRRTFHTLAGRRVKVYTKQEFSIDEIDLVYYREPRHFDILGYKHEDGRDSSNASLEFKDDVAELIIEEAAGIVAGKIESFNQYNVSKTDTQGNT